jgi:HAD superfamily hydrolase (TIGR01484 family)
MTDRLLALDLDGTLLRSDLSVSPRNHAAVARCLSAGIRVTLATGRTYGSALPYARLWPDHILWIAACNGAVIRPSDGGSPLRESLISLPLARQVASWAQQEQLYLKTYVDDLLLVSRATAETARFAEAQRVPYVAVGNVAAHLTKGPAKMVLIDEPTTIPSLEAEIRRRWAGQLEVTLSAPDCLELTHPGVTKGAALAVLARRAGSSIPGRGRP